MNDLAKKAYEAHSAVMSAVKAGKPQRWDDLTPIERQASLARPRAPSKTRSPGSRRVRPGCAQP